MSDFALDAFGALDLSTNDFRLLTGADAVAQHLEFRLAFFQGEWFRDQRIGIPYLQQIFAVKNPNLVAIRGVFRIAITTTPGVEQLERIDLTFDRSTRELRLDFSAKLAGEDVARDFSMVFIL